MKSAELWMAEMRKGSRSTYVGLTGRSIPGQTREIGRLIVVEIIPGALKLQNMRRNFRGLERISNQSKLKNDNRSRNIFERIALTI